MLNNLKFFFKDSWFKGGNQILAFLFFFFSIGIIWQMCSQDNVHKEGVYTVGWVTDTEKIKGGHLVTLKYEFKSLSYRARLRSKYGGENIGEAYFIKVLANKPNEMVYLEGNRVPDCLLKHQIPSTGWQTLPDCR